MAASGVDIVSLDWTVTIEEARRRIGNKVRVRGQTDRGRGTSRRGALGSETLAGSIGGPLTP
jgi:hypothetical protein